MAQQEPCHAYFLGRAHLVHTYLGGDEMTSTSQPATDAGPVFVVGAGFSRAVSSCMPLVAGLDDRLRADISTFATASEGWPRSDFESLLTHLNEPEPWLTLPEALRNRALFLELADALHWIIREYQVSALDEPEPEWLKTLVQSWCDSNTTVISLNYDGLIEKAYTAHLGLTDAIDGFYGHMDLYPVPIVKITARTATLWGSEPNSVRFSLIKLHGSQNWYYSGTHLSQDQYYGESIYDIGIMPGWKSSIQNRCLTLGPVAQDKEPLILPPTLSKSGQFANETLQSQWRMARRALEAASQVFVLGYSLPVGDHSMRALLRETTKGKPVVIAARSAATAAIWNNALPDAIVDRTTYIRPDEPIPNFVRSFTVPISVA